MEARYSIGVCVCARRRFAVDGVGVDARGGVARLWVLACWRVCWGWRVVSDGETAGKENEMVMGADRIMTGAVKVN